MKSCLFLAGMSVFAVGAMWAQPVDRLKEFSVRGEVSTSKPLIGGFTAELTPPAGIREVANIGVDGRFEFRSVQPGPQELRVVGPGGTVIYQETVVVNGPNQVLAVRLPEENNVPRPTSGSITIQQLQHKVPIQAKRAFDRGEQAVAEGKNEESVEAFRQAVTIDPEFVDAWNELGAAEAATGDLAAAAKEFQKAIDIAPEHPMALPNLSIVLARLGRFHDAGTVARRALKVVPNSGRVRYILAASILIEGGDSNEALENLEKATSEVPKAHLVASDVLVMQGRQQEAIKHLEEYLKVAPSDDKERPNVEARLAALRQH
jgi:tetratricopeptide (TPR) repeat protein